MLNDIRVGLRLLWKAKTFTLASAITLAICVAANVALFAIVDHVLLRPLPWPNAERIVLMANQYPGAGVGVSNESAAPDYYDRLRETDVFDAQAMFNWANAGIDQDSTPTRVLIMNVTPSFFRVLGVSAALGRTFTEEEGEPGNERRVVLSDGLWRSAFGGDPQIIGRDVRLNGQPYTVVGVMPRTFSFLDRDVSVRLWRPLAFDAEQKSDDSRHSNDWQNIGVLKPRATVAQAQQQIDALNARNLERFPQYRQILENARYHTTVVPLRDNVVRDVKPTLYLLWGAALFVLLIGSANVANLVLVHTSARLRELVTRVAIGANRWQIARQLTIETLLLTTMATTGGLFIGVGALRLLGALNMLDLPRAPEIRVDAAVVGVTFAIAAGIGMVLGLTPLAQLLQINLAEVLTEQGRSSAGGRRTRLVRRVFVVAQVAFAFVLLAGAGLLLASFRRLQAVDPGFRPDGVLTAQVNLPGSRYKDDQSLVAFAREALQRLRAVPGVAAVGMTDSIPFGDNSSGSVIIAEGYDMQPGESLIVPRVVVASPGYFEAMGATLVRGRFFDSRDSATGPKTVVVDEKLARRFWSNQDPIGKRLYEPEDINNIFKVTDKTVFRTVVGVVRDLKLIDLVEGNGQIGAYYYPSDQRPRRGLTFALRAAGDPAALATSVRKSINGLDPELPVYEVRTMTERLNRSLSPQRAAMLLAMAFGVVAVLIAAIGVYGVLAYLVAQRTKEIGIRLALGSSTSAVFQLVMREGLALAAVGFVVGAAGVAALKRSLDSLLFGVSAADVSVLAAATMLLAIVATAAGAVPARRATHIDPMTALTE